MIQHQSVWVQAIQMRGHGYDEHLDVLWVDSYELIDDELCEVFDEQYDDEQREQHFEVCWIIIPQCEKLYQR